jgi:hypothetical protein
MAIIINYPVAADTIPAKFAPYVYTERGEQAGKEAGTEPRTAGTIACFGGKPLRHGMIADKWLDSGYIKLRDEAAPALLGQITIDDVIISGNPWNYMRAMFEPAPLMIAEDLHKTARIEAYNDRRQARIDGLKTAAANRQHEADRRLNAGWSKLDAIPFGQPVHGVRDRNYRDKAARQIDRGYEISKEADAMEAKAQAAENNHSISSDDPLAVEKLTKKLDTLQKAQDTMKAVNAYYRKHKTLTGCAGCVAVSDSIIKAAADNINGVHGVPFPAWCLSNNNAEIRRIKNRIEELKQRAEQEPREWSGTGWTAETDLDDNRIRVYFDEKPDDVKRGILKSNGFKWSPKAGAWQRQITASGIWAMNRIAERLA